VRRLTAAQVILIELSLDLCAVKDLKRNNLLLLLKSFFIPFLEVVRLFTGWLRRFQGCACCGFKLCKNLIFFVWVD
jgi:hypothetical protein